MFDLGTQEGSWAWESLQKKVTRTQKWCNLIRNPQNQRPEKGEIQHWSKEEYCRISSFDGSWYPEYQKYGCQKYFDEMILGIDLVIGFFDIYSIIIINNSFEWQPYAEFSFN